MFRKPCWWHTIPRRPGAADQWCSAGRFERRTGGKRLEVRKKNLPTYFLISYPSWNQYAWSIQWLNKLSWLFSEVLFWVWGWSTCTGFCVKGSASYMKAQRRQSLHDSWTKKIHKKMCIFFSTQELRRLHQCDYPAAHDSEYKEDIDDSGSAQTHIKSLHHRQFEHKLLVPELVTVVLHLLTGLTAFMLLQTV